jgi:uncharacterized protein (TIGR02722 family)
MHKLAVIVTLAVLATGCSYREVARVDPDKVRDLSGRWNDTDSRLVAEEMLADGLSRPWLEEARTALGRKPTLIVQTVKNASLEHINTSAFVEELQRAMLNSGRVEFVASKAEREEIRDEKFDQQENATAATRKELGQEQGADFALNGVINAIKDKAGGDTVMFYQVNLKLTDLKTNKIVWIGEKKIKKEIYQEGAGF